MNTYESLCSLLESFPEEVLSSFLSVAESVKKDLDSGRDPSGFAVGGTPDPEPGSTREPVTPCPRCGHEHVVRFGFKDGKQRFLCRGCGRTFVRTTGTIMENSRFSEDVWESLISDTLDGTVSMDSTAESLGMHHSTVFHLRHKILMALEQHFSDNPAVLGNISELDETYVLECLKGTKFSAGSLRKPRKHGARASGRGISDEQVCIMTGVQRDGGPAFATTVNRASPSAEEIGLAFSGHIADGCVAFTDGRKGYKHLETVADCLVESAKLDTQKKNGTFSLNTVNGFHSHIKEMYRRYRGVATKYLNRYNTLFSSAFRSCMDKGIVGALLGRCIAPSYSDVRESGILCV